MNGSIITIDSREPGKIKGLGWDGCLTAVSTLPFGDVRIDTPTGETILIERKTPADFLESIKDRRLFNQAAGMVEITPWAYVVVEGWFQPNSYNNVSFVHNETKISIAGLGLPLPTDTNWQWSSLQGGLRSVQEMGCMVLYNPDFQAAVAQIMNRSRGQVKVAPPRGHYIFSPAELILASLPGVGSKKAQRYLEEFKGNVAMALTAMTAPHDGKTNYLEGWGQKSRDNLVEALGGRLEIMFDEEDDEK